MPTQKEIDAALKAIVEEREKNNAMGRRYPTQEDEVRTALAAAEKARAA
jgi:hypothetical protein